MKYFLTVSAVLFLFVSMTSLGFAEDSETIPLVGVNEAGESLEVQIPQQKFQESLTRASKQLQGAAQNSLSKSASRAWNLREVLVGLSVRVKVGWDKIIDAELVPGFRLIYSRTDAAKGGVQ